MKIFHVNKTYKQKRFRNSLSNKKKYENYFIHKQEYILSTWKKFCNTNISNFLQINSKLFTSDKNLNTFFYNYF